MSVKFLRRWSHGCLAHVPSDTDRFVWVCLANFCDDEGRVQISQSQIASLCALTARGVRNSLDRLVVAGVLRVVQVGKYDRTAAVYDVLTVERRSGQERNAVQGNGIQENAVQGNQKSLTEEQRSASTLHSPHAPARGGADGAETNGATSTRDPRKRYAEPDRNDPQWTAKGTRFFDHEITRQTLLGLDRGDSLEAIEEVRAALVEEAHNPPTILGRQPLPDYVPPPWPEEAAANAPA